MWSTPSSTARRRTASAPSRSRGGPNTPGPASCMAPKPIRPTSWLPSLAVSVWVMHSRVRYGRWRHKKGIDRGTRTTTLRRAPLGAHGLPQDPARAADAAGRRPSGERAAPHARPASRGGRPARRGRAVLVHVARAGPRHQAVRAGARRARPRPAARHRRARAPLPPRPRRAAAARRRLPARGAARPRRTSSSASRRTRPTCSARAPTSWPGTPPRRRCSASRRAHPTDGRTSCGGSSPTGEPRTEQRQATARSTLARFRAEHARRIGDPDFAALIDALNEASEQFRALVAAPRGARRAARHEDHRAPRASGRLVLHHLQSAPTSHPDLRLIQFAPADEATRDALTRLVAAVIVRR